MDKMFNLVQEANGNFKVALHLAGVIYPMVNDNKVLLSVSDKLYNAILNGVDAILYYEKANKNISVVPADFNLKLDLFESEVLDYLGLNSRICSVARELKSVLNEHEESPVEFSRNGSFVICSEGYERITTLDAEHVKKNIGIVRDFLIHVNKVAGKNV